MKYNKSKMPTFGVGPIYVLTCLILTISGLLLHFKGILRAGICERYKLFFQIAGIILIIFGVYLWIRAVVIEKINKNISAGKLVTTGIYGVVRNPIYTAFTFLFTGILLLTSNYILLILPLIFWIFLTMLMKNTEEKWLKDVFGKEYEEYCSQVNRVIPWFKRKTKK